MFTDLDSLADPLGDAAAAGELNLASWRVWRYRDLLGYESQLCDLLIQKTDFPNGHPGRPLLAEAITGDDESARAIGSLLASGEEKSDVVGSWTCLAALRGNAVAQQSLVATLIDRARRSKGCAGRRLWRCLRSWAPALTLCGLSGKTVGSNRLWRQLATARGEHEEDNEASGENIIATGPTCSVLGAPIPADNREDRAIANAWKVLEQPLRLGAQPPLDVLQTVLAEEFPWLGEAIAAIVGDLRLRAWAGQTWVQWRPTMLVGPPGSGKTRFVRRLAELSGVGFGEVNAAGSGDNRCLQGTSRGYASATPSQVIHTMRASLCANPVIMVDELDKCQPDGRNGDIRQTLLGMLEPLSAASWPDECLMTPVNLRHVNWIMCANDVTPLRGPLLTRMRVVEAPAPRAEHFDAVLCGMRRDLAAELEVSVSDLPTLSAHHLKAFRNAFRKGISLRRIRSAHEAAVLAELPRTRRLHH